MSLIKNVCLGMDPACCRAPCAYWSPGSEGPGDEPKSQAWLGVHHCIWLPKGQNSLEAPSPIWPTSDGLKLSFDLKLLVIWSLLKKKKKKTEEEAWYLSGDLLPFLFSLCPSNNRHWGQGNRQSLCNFCFCYSLSWDLEESTSKAGSSIRVLLAWGFAKWET